MRRILTLAAIFIAILIVLTPARAVADAMISIQPSATIESVGNNFTLNVDISGVTDLAAFQFDIGFNPAVLSASGITEGSFLPSGRSTFFIPGTIDNGAGTIVFTADSLLGSGPGVNGSGALAAIDFTATRSGLSSVDLANMIFLDSAGGAISNSIANGSVNVSGVSPVPEPPALLLLATGAFLLICLNRKMVCPYQKLRAN